MTVQLAGNTQAAEGFGTLLWIGDRDHEAFFDAYDFCDTAVSQLAYRKSMTDAIRRPASSVRTIVLCLEHDTPLHRAAFQSICELHPECKPLLLTGPLCAGSRPSPAEQYGCNAIRWDRWESELPAYLRRCGWANQPQPAAHSILVVASDAENARALLSIASSGKGPAVWCRPEQVGMVQQMDEIWWDDSATKGVSLGDVLSSWKSSSGRHVWVAGDLSPTTKAAALQAGMEAVIAKPAEYWRLLDRVCERSDTGIRRAA
ncbi:MAG: hypothetical protein AAFV88_01060 [Planctomycetota bacterium]